MRWRIAQFCELHWWQRYLSGREKAAYLEWKRSYWLDFLQKSGISLPPGARVLDAGCGPAGIFTMLHGLAVDALDPLLPHYEKHLGHFSRADHPGVRFFATRLEDFFPEGQYDCVFCLNAVNHVADLQACIDRLAGLTAPGGTLAVSIDVHRFSMLKRLFRLIPADILHPHQYDLEEYREMIGSRGLVLERVVLLKEGRIFNYCLLVFRQRQQ